MSFWPGAAIPSVGLLHGVHKQRVHGIPGNALRADDQYHVVLGRNVVLVSQLRGSARQVRHVAFRPAAGIDG